MAVLLLEKDPFVEGLEALSEDLSFSEANIRRPLEGMLPKESRMAFLSLYRTDGVSFSHISLVDSSAPEGGAEGSGFSQATHNFVLQSVNHGFSEKVQIVETFGPFFAFFYGEKPQVLQCQGLLLNSRDFNWKNEWLRNYQRYLRGTKCVEYRARVYLGFDDVLIQGLILNTAVGYTAENPLVCPFNFSLLVTGYQDLSEGNEDYVLHSDHVRRTGNRVVEYLADPAESSFNQIDPITGLLTPASGSSTDAVGSAESLQTASWAGDGSTGRLWKDPAEAASAIDIDLAVQQTEGSDRVTAQIQRRSNPSSYPMASRSENSSTLSRSLDKGVANGALVIGAHPVVI